MALLLNCGDISYEGVDFDSVEAALEMESPAIGVSCLEGACSSESLEVESFFRNAAQEALHVQANGQTTAPDVIDIAESWGYQELKRRGDYICHTAC